jgi:hypothetical protein
MTPANEARSPAEERSRDVYFFSTIWWGLFLGAAIAISLVLLIVVLFPLGISVASDRVFGALALVSGLLADSLFRWGAKRRVMISKKLPFSLLYAWVPLCLCVMMARPFE